MKHFVWVDNKRIDILLDAIDAKKLAEFWVKKGYSDVDIEQVESK